MPTVERDLTTIADMLERRLVELVAAIVARIGAEVPELEPLASEQLSQLLSDGCRRALVSELSYLRSGAGPPASCPPEAAESARLAAGAGFPLAALLQTQRIAHAVVWDAYVDEGQQIAGDAGTLRELLDAGSRFFFAYGDALARQVGNEYERELERTHGSGERRRLAAVMEVLRGSSPDPALLGYDLALEHVGVIAWGGKPAAAIRELARLLDRRALVVSASDAAVWGWIGGRRELDEGVLARFDPGACRMALGEPSPNPAGFRDTHTQAHEARRVALRRERPVTRYRDVALEAFSLRDEALARAFVEAELGPLGAGDRGAALRATLRAYFDCSQNASATAAALGVHEQTVGQRLRAVEQQIGTPVNVRRAELDIALRVEDLLDSP
jgi:hypothetical protein